MLKRSVVAVMVVLLAVAMAAVAQQKGGEDEIGHYDLAAGWPLPVCGEGYQSGSVPGVFAETPDRVFVFQRGCLPELPPSSSIVPSRNAAGYSLAASNQERWPRWDHILMIFNQRGSWSSPGNSTTGSSFGPTGC